MFRDLGPSEILLILAVIILLFGAKKLPELARGSGRALRIFRAETKGLIDDEGESTKTPEQREVDARAAQERQRSYGAPGAGDAPSSGPGGAAGGTSTRD